MILNDTEMRMAARLKKLHEIGRRWMRNETMEPCKSAAQKTLTWKIPWECLKNGETNLLLSSWNLTMSIRHIFSNGKMFEKARESVAKKRRRQTIFSWEEDSAELEGEVAIDVCQTNKINSRFTKMPCKFLMEVVTSLRVRKRELYIHFKCFKDDKSWLSRLAGEAGQSDKSEIQCSSMILILSICLALFVR